MKINKIYANGKQFEVGDRVSLYGYTGTIIAIKADWEEERDTKYKGLRFQHAEVVLDPSVDHIENTAYGKGAYGTFSMIFIG